MEHTDFGEWRVTHDDLKIYHASQPFTLDFVNYSDAEKLVAALAAVSAEDWVSSTTMDDLVRALDFALDLRIAHATDQAGSADSESIKKR